MCALAAAIVELPGDLLAASLLPALGRIEASDSLKLPMRTSDGRR